MKFSRIVDKFKSVGKYISTKYQQYTGESTNEKAEKLYDDIMKSYNQHKAYFEEKVCQKEKNITSYVNSINNAKVLIKKELFPDFANKIRLLKDVSITEDFINECYSGISIDLCDIRHRDELFFVDFNKNRFKINVANFLTFGIYGRKLANINYNNVKEEEQRLELEKFKMNSELKRLEVIEESLQKVDLYYKSLIDKYKRMLLRMDNSVNFLLIKTISIAHRFISSEMSIYNLPISQQKEIQAMTTMSLILSEIVKTSIMIDSSEISICEINKIEKQTKQFNKDFNAA